jgi:hypothetical protein
LRRAAERSRASSPSIQASSNDALTVHFDERKDSCNGSMIFILYCTRAQFVDRGIVNNWFCIEVVGDRASGVAMFDGLIDLVVVLLVKVHKRANGIAVQVSVGLIVVLLVRVHDRPNGIAVRTFYVMIVDMLVFETAMPRAGSLTRFRGPALLGILGRFTPMMLGKAGVYRGIRGALIAARAGAWRCAALSGAVSVEMAVFADALTWWPESCAAAPRV